MDKLFTDEQGAPRRVRGVTVNSGSTLLAGLAAEIGFEAVWVEMEHSPINLERVDAVCLAIEAGGAAPLVRIPDGDRHHVLRALEAGARIVVVPMIDEPDQARRLVEYGKYPPVGARGFNVRTRGLGFGLQDPLEALARANMRTHIFAQIETPQAVANLDAICQVEGLDGVFMGPGDLSASMGIVGQANDPRVVEVVVNCIRRARAAGKLTGIFTVPGPLLEAAMAAGCELVVCGGDIMDLAGAWKDLLQRIDADLP
ncbi:MAG: 2-dehydro-3-deoxyglucarate aldolase [Candidatus Latescibacteria bacterium]|nr:2-dehydro-3-deoxyglucarate aldolase [Candidatus Latescibacterota bacterium]